MLKWIWVFYIYITVSNHYIAKDIEVDTKFLHLVDFKMCLPERNLVVEICLDESHYAHPVKRHASGRASIATLPSDNPVDWVCGVAARML